MVDYWILLWRNFAPNMFKCKWQSDFNGYIWDTIFIIRFLVYHLTAAVNVFIKHTLFYLNLKTTLTHITV